MSAPAVSIAPSRVERFGETIAWLFAVAFVITVYEVAMRYLFRAPTSWVHVTVTTLCAICFSFGGAYSMARDEHMRVSSLTERLPARAQAFAEVLGYLCGLIYLLGLAYGTVAQAYDSVWRFESARWIPEPMPGPPGWPMPAIVKAAVAAGTLLFLAVLSLLAVRKASHFLEKK